MPGGGQFVVHLARVVAVVLGANAGEAEVGRELVDLGGDAGQRRPAGRAGGRVCGGRRRRRAGRRGGPGAGPDLGGVVQPADGERRVARDHGADEARSHAQLQVPWKVELLDHRGGCREER